MLLDGTKSGPEVKPYHGVSQWQGPRFFLYPSSSTLVFGGSPGNLFGRLWHLWIANLADGSVRETGFTGHVHDDDMSGRAKSSPDGAVLLFGIRMSRLAPPFLVDNYITLGERLVVVDIRTSKTIDDVKPPHDETPLAVAVDHRNKHTILLINWGTRWEFQEFADRDN